MNELESQDAEPDYELAVILLAQGCAQAFIRERCRFPTHRAVQAFCREDETRKAVAALHEERRERVGRSAMVSLERIVSAETFSDLRAQVLAIRTALEVSGNIRRDTSPPVKSVRELSVAELNELIATTRSELDARITVQRAGRKLDHTTT